MAGDTLRPGDRVVMMQVAGVCTVLGLRGRYVDLETPQGRKLTVVVSAVRRVEWQPGEPVKAG